MRHADPTPMPTLRRARVLAAAALLAATLAACGEAPPPPPAEAAPAEAPAPATGEHTALRDAMQAPIDRAEDARAATEAADAERAQALEDAGG